MHPPDPPSRKPSFPPSVFPRVRIGHGLGERRGMVHPTTPHASTRPFSERAKTGMFPQPPRYGRQLIVGADGRGGERGPHVIRGRVGGRVI